MSTRTNVSSGGKLEEPFGYSRAVRMGDHIHVAGTVATGTDGETVGADAREQAIRCFEIIGSALDAAGANLANVVRTRVYVSSPEHAQAVGEVHGEIFGEVRPAMTMVVARLLRDEWLVEIEAYAYAPETDAPGDDDADAPTTH